MSSFFTPLLDQHLHRLESGPPSDQLRLSRRAADRFAVLEAVREQRRDQQSARSRRSGQRLRRLLAARSRADHGISTT